MRILVDARKLGDFGIGTYIRGLLGAATAMRPNWRFDLLVPARLDALPPELQCDNVRAVPEPAAGYSVAELAAPARHARRVGAHLFHAPHYVWPYGLPCPGVVTIHDDIHLRFPEFLPRPLGWLPRFPSRLYAARMMHRAAHRAAHVITVSEAARADLMDRLLIPSDRITAILNGGGAEALAQHATAPGSDTPAGLPQRFVLFVGNPKPHKNLGGLMTAFARVAGEFPDLHLVIVGHSGPTPWAAQLDEAIAERVLSLGWLPEPDLRATYRRASVLCVPSLYEGFGLPALEAMAAGTAVIASDAGGLSEVLAGAGILVPPGDSAALADAIARLLRDENLAAALSRRGRERAARLSWERAARRTVAIYERVAGISSA